MTFEVFAKKDPIRAAKRFAKAEGLGDLDFDWTNATILEGRIQETTHNLDPFESDILHGLLSGEIKTERIV